MGFGGSAEKEMAIRYERASGTTVTLLRNIATVRSKARVVLRFR